MILKTNIEEINKILSQLPDVFYHGRVGKPISIEEMQSQIVIYKNINEISGKKFWELKGRTYLDCAFHGFYLTPCEALARKWAFTKVPKTDEVYQVLVFKADKVALSKLNSKINIVPDLEWAQHIFECRARRINENQYDFIYSFIADGIMSEIYPKIESGHYEENIIKFHQDILKENHKKFLQDFYGKRELKCREIIECCNLGEYKNYQLCISSEKALKSFELIDIISMHSDINLPDNISVDVDLKEFKKFVPDALMDLLCRERSE